MIYEVFIPSLPPGINQTYSPGVTKKGKPYTYKTNEARDWSIQAALIIGAKAGEIGWEDKWDEYEIEILFNNWNQDADAPVKLVIDTVTQKLGFDDKKISKQCSEKVKDLESKGVLVKLKPYAIEQDISG